MIEPDMATMLAFVLTDVRVDAEEPGGATEVVGRTFNSLSVDTDTSTSDTAAVLASGTAGEADLEDLHAALAEVCTDLDRPPPTGRSDYAAGRRGDRRTRRRAGTACGQSVVNSPLVKTASTVRTPTGAGWRWQSASAARTPTSTSARCASPSGAPRCTRSPTGTGPAGRVEEYLAAAPRSTSAFAGHR
ncbi:MAG: bifunctional ornithine acetyltransferase/N-acetylglutamate synthase [Microthrixaceae bacterium]